MSILFSLMMRIFLWGIQMTDKGEEDKTKIEDNTKVEEETAVEFTPTEEQALDQGWVPKEDWVKQGGDPDEWRTAKEFVDRGELYKSLHSTKRDLKQTQAALGALQKHHGYVYERAYQQALQDLKREKRQAIRNEDFEKLEDVEDRIETLQTEHQETQTKLVAEQQAAQVAGPNPVMEQWKERNRWYDNDQDLREFADATGLIYINKNPGVAPAEVLRHVEAKVKRNFPDKFQTKRAAPNAVAGIDREGKPANKVKDDIFLDDMEMDIMKTFVQSGVMTEAEYKAELKKARGK